MKEHNHFDKIIKEKVDNFSVPLEDGAWELFNKKNQATPNSQEEGDAIIDQKAAALKVFETPFNRHHWALLAERIQKELIFIRELTHLKVMELSLMVLMLLSFWQQLPVQNATEPTPYQSPIAQQTDHPMTTVPAPANQEISTPNIPRAASTSSTQLTAYLPQVTSSTAALKGKQSVPYALSEISILPSKEILPPRPVDRILPRPPATNIETITPKLLAQLEEEPISKYRPVKNKALVKIGMIGRSENNIIVSNTDNIPSDQVITTNIYQQASSGYSGGVSLGLAKGKWEYHLKLFYSAINYQPIDVTIVTGSTKNYVGKKYANFEFNTFQVPLAVRYNIIDRNQWKLFTSLGASWHLVAQSFYHTQDQEFTNNRTEIIPRGEIPDPIGAEQAHPGLFQAGGKFLTNSYFTGNLGFGIERSFGGKWSTFIASRYAHTFYNVNGGLGPYKDNVHTLSFESGIIMTLHR